MVPNSCHATFLNTIYYNFDRAMQQETVQNFRTIFIRKIVVRLSFSQNIFRIDFSCKSFHSFAVKDRQNQSELASFERLSQKILP